MHRIRQDIVIQYFLNKLSINITHSLTHNRTDVRTKRHEIRCRCRSFTYQYTYNNSFVFL